MRVNVYYYTNAQGMGVSLNRDLNRYKIYAAETGLFVSLVFKDKDFTENVIYQKLLSDKLDANLGFVYEYVIAQTLVANGKSLFYYTFPTEKGNHLYEIDFLLPQGNKVCPIEVKSSSYKRHASLNAFCSKYSSRVGSRYVLYTKDLHKDGNVLYLQVYMAQSL